MFEDMDRHALFHEMHRSIEESATVAAEKPISGSSEVTYPPHGGFSPDEAAALQTIPRTPAMESALRKMIADAAAYPMFHLLSLADGVVDPPSLRDLQEQDRTAVEIMLHDGFYESYWGWRRRRSDPGWRLDTYPGT